MLFEGLMSPVDTPINSYDGIIIAQKRRYINVTSEQTTIFLIRVITDEGDFTHFDKAWKNGCHSTDDVYKSISFKDKFCIYLAHISLTFVLKGPKLKMTWRQTGVIEHKKDICTLLWCFQQYALWLHHCDYTLITNCMCEIICYLYTTIYLISKISNKTSS